MIKVICIKQCESIVGHMSYCYENVIYDMDHIYNFTEWAKFRMYWNFVVIFYNKYFISLAEYRQKKINEVLND